MKTGKKKHDDNGNDDDDDNEGEGEGKEVTDDGKGPKRAKRAAKVAKCVSTAFYIYINSNVLYRRKALDQMREDMLTSAAPLLKKLLQYVPLPPFFFGLLMCY